MNRTVPIVVLSAAAVFLGLGGQHLGLPSQFSSSGSSLDGRSSGAFVSPGGLNASSAGKIDLTTLVIDGRGRTPNVVVGNGGWASLAAGYRTRYTRTAPEPHVHLERRIGRASWAATDVPVLPDQDGILRARTPIWSTDRTSSVVQYRFVSEAYADAATGGVGAASTSNAVRVTYENQEAYTGMARRIYRAASAFCPSTAVHVEALSGTRAGLYGSGSQLIKIDQSVGVTSERDDRDVRAVALHECSHERQWMNYSGTSAGREAMERAASAFFSDFDKPAGVVTPYRYHEPDSGTIDPVEHAADCGAQAVNPGGYLGYGGYCSPAQLDAGRRLLLGQRY